MIEENGNSIIINGTFVFYKTFIESYRGLTVVQARRKLKSFYTRSMQDLIIRFLKEKGAIKTGIQ